MRIQVENGKKKKHNTKNMDTRHGRNEKLRSNHGSGVSFRQPHAK